MVDVLGYSVYINIHYIESIYLHVLNYTLSYILSNGNVNIGLGFLILCIGLICYRPS